MYCSQFLTSHGPGFVFATDQGVVKVQIPDLSGHEPADHKIPSDFKSSGITAHVAHLLEKYFIGEQVDFGATPVVLDNMTLFRQLVLKAVQNIRYGEIYSYGNIAHECGSPLASRAVGGALASNPIPVIIPCHRVVASNGRLTGFSAPGGEETKLALLKMEGIEFNGMLVVTKQLVMHRI